MSLKTYIFGMGAFHNGSVITLSLCLLSAVFLLLGTQDQLHRCSHLKNEFIASGWQKPGWSIEP